MNTIVKLQSVPTFEEIREILNTDIKPIFACEECHLFIRNASGNFDLCENDNVVEIDTDDCPIFLRGHKG